MSSTGCFTARRTTLRHFALIALAGLAWATVAWAATPAATGERPRNIIIMIADGAAATQWDFGRYSSRVLRGQPFATTDVIFRQGALGLLVTSANDAYVTDSAAAGSSMSTGYKVNIGAVSVTPDGKAVPTVMEAAKASGKRTGLVTTSTVYDATPAAFTVHAKSRANSQALVDQYAAFQPDVLLGGGADYFLPKGVPGGKRSDGADVIALFRAKGHLVVGNTAELRAARAPRLLGLFADDDMDFEIERDASREPSTAEMTAAAINALEQDSAKGFVLLVENENVDTAGHANDAAALMRALWAFDDAVKVAIEFQRRSPDTLLIVTGDHETGGFSPTYALRDLSSLSSGNRFYTGDAQLRMLEGITMSFNALREKLGSAPTGAALDQLLAQHFSGFKLDADLRELILNRQPLDRNAYSVPQNVLGRMVARQTGYYWGTGGHTPQPVVVGAIGPGAEAFRGYQDNTEFGKRLHLLIEGR
jgi:alkaline phosphatase